MVVRLGRYKVPQQKDKWVDDDPGWVDDTPEQGVLSKGWDFANTSLFEHGPDWLNPSKRVSSRISKEPSVTPEDWNIPFTGGAKWKGLRQGIEQGAADVMSSLASPLNLGTMALTGGSSMAARQGLPQIAKSLSIGGKVASAPMAAHGGSQILSPDSTLSERGLGLTELAGGIAGMRYSPHIQGKLPTIAEKIRKPIPEEINWAELTKLPPDKPISKTTDLMDTFQEQPSTPASFNWPEAGGHYEADAIGSHKLIGSTSTLDDALPSGTKDRLRELGHSLDDIDAMSSSQADTILSKSGSRLDEQPVPGARPLSDYTPEDLARGRELELGMRGIKRNELNSIPEETGMIPHEQGIAVRDKAIEGEILSPDQYSRMGDPNTGSQFGNTKRITPLEADPEHRATMRQLWGDMSSNEISRHIELQSAMNGPLSGITPEMHAEFVALGKRRPGGITQPDQYLMKQQAEQTRLENVERNRLKYSGQKLIGDGQSTSEMPRESSIKPTIDESRSTAQDSNVVDKYEPYRKAAVGTKYTISPEHMNRRRLTDAIKLGFEYEGLDDKGRIILRKVKPSPEVNMPEPPELEKNAWLEAANLPRTLMASMDMSAPLRQGLGLIHKKAFWTSLPSMLKAWGSEDAYKQIQASILSDPMFQKRVTANGQVKPSFAEESGLSLTNLLNTREESMMSSLAERVPGVRRSNRAYTAFLNKLRADTFKQMTTDFGATTGTNMRNNVKLAKEIAGFINAASGRGSLGKLEPSAKALSTVLFSPRLIASRLGMMSKGVQAVFSPEVYMMSNNNVRREYLKSLFAIASVGNGFTQLLRLGGGTIETSPASSDFGKAKIGNTRIDPYGGFQQMIVAAQRIMPQLDLSSIGLSEIGGKMKSSTTGREYDLTNPKFGQSDRMDVALRFVRSKTNPIINFGWGLLAGQKEMSGKPMKMTEPNPFENAIAQRFLPMLTQDIYEMVQDTETPMPVKGMATFLAGMGMGTQTYGNR